MTDDLVEAREKLEAAREAIRATPELASLAEKLDRVAAEVAGIEKAVAKVDATQPVSSSSRRVTDFTISSAYNGVQDRLESRAVEGRGRQLVPVRLGAPDCVHGLQGGDGRIQPDAGCEGREADGETGGSKANRILQHGVSTTSSRRRPVSPR